MKKILLILLMIYGVSFAVQAQTWEKSISGELPDRELLLMQEHMFGKVEVIGENISSIQFQGKIVISTTNTSWAKEQVDKFYLDSHSTLQEAYLVFKRPAQIPKGVDYRVDLIVRVPKEISVNMKTFAGVVNVSSVHGFVELTGQKSIFSGTQLSGKARLTGVQQVNLDRFTGALFLEGGKDTTLNNITGDVFITSHQGNLNITGLTLQQGVIMNRGTISGQKIFLGDGNLTLVNEQGTIDLKFTGDSAFTYVVDGDEGTVFGTLLNKEVQKGQIRDGSGVLYLRNKQGKIVLKIE